MLLKEYYRLSEIAAHCKIPRREFYVHYLDNINPNATRLDYRTHNSVIDTYFELLMLDLVYNASIINTRIGEFRVVSMERPAFKYVDWPESRNQGKAVFKYSHSGVFYRLLFLEDTKRIHYKYSFLSSTAAKGHMYKLKDSDPGYVKYTHFDTNVLKRKLQLISDIIKQSKKDGKQTNIE